MIPWSIENYLRCPLRRGWSGGADIKRGNLNSRINYVPKTRVNGRRRPPFIYVAIIRADLDALERAPLLSTLLQNCAICIWDAMRYRDKMSDRIFYFLKYLRFYSGRRWIRSWKIGRNGLVDVWWGEVNL